ncbi:MAG: hypothetical protein KME60_03345 [Cyanomargarita calcarea GSE-NOS-MK-12-04C]|uniref:Uncharacterized protein n=1 Tax=Cyanomargarita calcarea GSE-NOS-MK-12-04C TaxID=2839659 RepID=A0A951URQ4_9CYAN|nr:hypothetical protein [Cyanomargarita calcarea GSE-NOS-MK-12-04C]
MQLDDTPQLNKGRLFLCDYDKGILGRWVATSGLGAFQRIQGWSKQGGGVCPPTYECNPTFANYWVETKPIDLRNNPGVAGNGYPITPYEVRTKQGVTRSDLLIHKDANVPGSMGCIVLPSDEFTDFEQSWTDLVGHLEKVKLWVGYTY